MDDPLFASCQMKLYERERPWRLEMEAVKPRLKAATEELAHCKQALEHCREASTFWMTPYLCCFTEASTRCQDVPRLRSEYNRQYSSESCNEWP